MQKRRVKAKKLRLLAGGALLLSLTACDFTIDLSDFFLDFELPAPVVSEATIEYYDISSSPFYNAATFVATQWNEDSMMDDSQLANIAANLASLANDSENISVQVIGHAEKRCTEAIWQARRGRNYGNSRGTWCSPISANGTSPQGRLISLDRAETVKGVLEALLVNNHGVPLSKVSFDASGVGESEAQAPVGLCAGNANHPRCKEDRRVDVFVSSRTYVGGRGGVPVYAYPGNYPSPEAEIPAPPTCLDLGNCPADPKPIADPAGFTGSGFAFAQQNADQLIKFKLGALTCNNGQPAPCGVPSSGEMRTGVSGPYLVSASVGSFNLNAPAGYAQPRDYRITSNPTGSPIGAGVSAKLRFYAATRTAAPYTYSATAAVTIEWHNWQWDGSTMTVTSKTTEQLPTTSLVCAPVKTPACSFGVLGSNVN
jgi:hypothetical protein